MTNKLKKSESNSFFAPLWSIIHFFFGNPKDYYGKHYATEDVKNSARITYATVTISNVIDGASVFPLLLISFGGNVVFASIVSILLTVFSNYLGAAAASRKKGNKGWSSSSLRFLVAINIIMSATAFVSPELMLNESGIAEVRADELVKIQGDKIKNITPSPAQQKQLSEAESKCQKLKKEIQKFPRGSVQRQDTFRDMYGLYRDINRDWSEVPVSQQPWCVRSKTLSVSVGEKSRKAQAEWEETETIIAAAPSTITGIKTVLPELYDQHFDESGEVRSGTEEARIAIEVTYSKLMKGELMQLGFSLFIFSVSVVTSAASVFLVVNHNKREDVQMSFNEQLSILEEEYQRGNIED